MSKERGPRAKSYSLAELGLAPKTTSERVAAMRAAQVAGVPFDVAVIDLHMPDVDGFSMARHIRADPALAETPLMMLTSLTSRGDARASQEAGFDAYLTKPVKKSLLESGLRTLIGQSADAQPDALLITRHTLAESALPDLGSRLSLAEGWRFKTTTLDRDLTIITNGLANIVPDNYVLSDKNIADVQKILPNRNGMTTDHGMWTGASAAKGGIGNGGKPDTQNKACMKNCKPEVQIGSTLPDYARTAHGELYDQNRNFGPVRGTKTLGGAAAAAPVAVNPNMELATKSGCMACHGVNNKIVGPGYNEVETRYKGQPDAEDRLVAKVKAGGQGVWGAVPMPPNGHLKDEDLKTLVKWILSGAK